MSKVRLVSWNICCSKEPKYIPLLEKDGYDVALLQEFPLSEESWEREHYDRGAKVLQLSDRVELCKLQNIPPGRKPERGELTVSAPGIIAAAHITPESAEPLIAVSLYARWEYPHPCTKTSWGVGYADAMAPSGHIGLKHVHREQEPGYAQDRGCGRFQSHPRCDG